MSGTLAFRQEEEEKGELVWGEKVSPDATFWRDQLFLDDFASALVELGDEPLDDGRQRHLLVVQQHTKALGERNLHIKHNHLTAVGVERG